MFTIVMFFLLILRDTQKNPGPDLQFDYNSHRIRENVIVNSCGRNRGRKFFVCFSPHFSPPTNNTLKISVFQTVATARRMQITIFINNFSAFHPLMRTRKTNYAKVSISTFFSLYNAFNLKQHIVLMQETLQTMG
jgi:hypothetical protein